MRLRDNQSLIVALGLVAATLVGLFLWRDAAPADGVDDAATNGPPAEPYAKLPSLDREVPRDAATSAARTAPAQEAAAETNPDEPQPSADLPPIWIEGVARLSDGSPFGGVTILARAVLPASDQEAASATFAKPLGRTQTDELGNFRLRLPGEKKGRLFKLRHLGFGTLAPPETEFRARPSDWITYVATGGALVAHVARPDGSPAAGLTVRLCTGREPGVELSTDASARLKVDEQGEARHLFGWPGFTSLEVRDREANLVARLLDVPLSIDASNPDVYLRLQPNPDPSDGRLRITVRTESGREITDFAVRITRADNGELVRMVYSGKLEPPGLIEGLPRSELKLRPSENYAGPPFGYTTEGVDAQVIDLDASPSAEVEFVARAVARIAFELRADSHSDPLGVRYRVPGAGADGWTKLGSLWSYPDRDRAMVSTSMRAPGEYFSDPLPSGPCEIEVRGNFSSELVWSGTPLLVAGERHRVVLDP